MFDPGGDAVKPAIGGESCSSFIDCGDAIPCGAEEQQDFAQGAILGPEELAFLEGLVAANDFPGLTAFADQHVGSLELISGRHLLVVRAPCGDIYAALQLAVAQVAIFSATAAELIDG